ncbi:hypothetical protein ABT133_19020 [Streptomyces sp. NPDC001835]|uniref:hypothetical protein n=1 Tax=unclassified Streptomyces TaxID=2593676 RepID=UPI00332724AB
MIEAPSRISEGDRTTAADRRQDDCLEAVAPHLSLLRHSLAGGTRRDRYGRAGGRSERGHVQLPRRRPAPAAGRLTLPQWVSRTKNVG